MLNIEERKIKAMENFSAGYNCAQAVVLAFEDIINIDSKILATISAPLGGGMGRLREVCGAVSGMFMVSGFIHNNYDPKDRGAKIATYQTVQSLAEGFRELNGSIICRELLGLSVKQQVPVPEERTEAYYKKRPCKELVGIAAELVAEAINREAKEKEREEK